MQIYDLIIQIFMAATLISGTIMLVLSVAYRHRLRHTERMGRYILSSLLLYSVFIRFWILLPGRFEWARESSIIFDILYITLTILFNFNVLRRRAADGREDKRDII